MKMIDQLQVTLTSPILFLLSLIKLFSKLGVGTGDPAIALRIGRPKEKAHVKADSSIPPIESRA